VELGAHVGRLHDHATPRIDRTGAGDPYRHDRIADLDGSGVTGRRQRLRAGTEYRRGSVRHGRVPLSASNPRAIVGHDSRAYLRAADVEREYGPD
jgi:hypothetical protein